MRAYLCRITGLEPEQLVPAALAAVYIFCVLASYYVLKPLREDIGLLIGPDYIPKLFMGTLIVMVLANPIFSALMNRYNRVTFIKFIYRFFILNIFGFILAFKYLERAGLMPEGGEAVKVTGIAFGVGVLFFIWVSVFNLFAVSIFWALMSDIYDSQQSKKIFGLVGAGGTLGQMAGSSLTTALVGYIGPTNLLFVSALLLELAVIAMKVLTAGYEEPKRKPGEKKPNALSGISDILKSPYLVLICLYLFLYTFTSTFLYFQKAIIVDETLLLREDRVAFFANISFFISFFTLIIQVFFTGRILPLFGLALGLSLVPVVTTVGFLVLGFMPGLMPLAIVEVIRSTANYGITRPAREILFTVVSRQERYLSKSFIDTFVYRAGDAVASGAFEAIKSFSFSISAISLIAVPIALAYLFVGLGLGRAQARRARAMEKDSSL